MDWARAIDINRTALTRVVAEIFALLGLVAGGTLELLPHGLYQKVERLLRPAESALRRLIVVAARGLLVNPTPKRAMPKGLKIARKVSGRMSFRLFDTRKRFDFIAVENPLLVNVKTYSSNPFNLFDNIYLRRPEKLASNLNAGQLCRRLAAVAHALETIPHQAQRLARWQAQRKLMEKPKFTFPLRPGPPPGLHVQPKFDVDFVLRECHGLALDVYREDSS
jgi:hypothetical protein